MSRVMRQFCWKMNTPKSCRVAGSSCNIILNKICSSSFLLLRSCINFWGRETGDYVCTRRLRRLPVGLLGLHVDRSRHEHRHGRHVRCIGLDVVDAGDAVFRHTWQCIHVGNPKAKYCIV